MKSEIIKSKKVRCHNDKIFSRKFLRSILYFNLSFLIIVFTFSAVLIPTVSAQENASFSDPTSKNFRIVVCDGPTLPNTAPDFLLDKAREANNGQYTPCDFNGLMLQIRHIINIMMILGVFASIGAFSWAGALYISGNPTKKTQAHKIFPKIFIGFIIMLSSWFIVFQILSWLTNNEGFKTLLGSPK